MSEYTNTFDDLRGDILGVLESMRDMHHTHSKLTDALAAEIGRVWEDNAALRDELHALANRVETLTRARLTEPAEVAEAMISRNDEHAAGSPFYREERGRYLIECDCGWEYEGKSEEDAKIALGEHFIDRRVRS